LALRGGVTAATDD